jgi:hypothetical protein
MSHVHLCRRVRNEQGFGDFAILEALGNEPENLAFAR